MAHSRHHSALIYILIGATFISFSGVWVAWSAVEPTVSAFYRAFLGTIFLGIGCLLRNEFQRIDLQSIFLIVLCSLAFSADLVCWHASIGYIGPGLATIIGNFQVFILTLISVTVFSERLSLKFVVSIPLAIAGLFMVIGFNWKSLPDDYLLGIGLAIATAIFYAIFLLLMRRIQARQQQPSLFYNLMLVSLGTSFILAIPIVSSDISFAVPSLSSLGALVGLALFSQTIGWTFIANSLPQLRPSLAGLILLLQPALAFIWDVLIFNRHTTLTNWSGVIIVLIAIYLGMSSSQKSR